ncbi:MAG: hypothetical protein V2A34_13915 [Lentisphaerota bacterium]
MHIDWADPEKETEISLQFTFDYDVARHKEDACRYRMIFRMSARSNKECAVGLMLDAEIAGFFTLPKEMEADKREYQIRVNGCAILYGVLRGQLALVTGSFPGGKFNLPSVMMQEVVETVEERKRVWVQELAKKTRNSTSRPKRKKKDSV